MGVQQAECNGRFKAEKSEPLAQLAERTYDSAKKSCQGPQRAPSSSPGELAQPPRGSLKQVGKSRQSQNIARTWASLCQTNRLSAFGSLFRGSPEWGYGTCTPSTTPGLKMPACHPRMLACLGSQMYHLALGNPEIANNCSLMKRNKALIPSSPAPSKLGKKSHKNSLLSHLLRLRLDVTANWV